MNVLRVLVPLLPALAFAAPPLPDPAARATVRTEPYVWRNVAIHGGGFVTGIVAHPRVKGLLYARTDVGGAYRTDDAGRTWIPLTDWVSQADWNLLGIESIAIDPADPRHVYLAAGTYSRFSSALLRSDDQGRNWQRADVPIAMGGNEVGRFAGERLAVDPNRGSVLLFGSRRDGLWRSEDRGATWRQVPGFPTLPPEPPPPPGQPAWLSQPVGIVAVHFDAASARPGEPTPVVHAAISTAGTHLYRSTDGGASWSAVPGQPTGLRPNHLAAGTDGTLYLSYGSGPGPHQMKDGAVWKLEPDTGVWTDITPHKPSDSNQPFGYGAVAVDPGDPRVVLATTFTHWRPHDQIFRSTDGGATWRRLWQDGLLHWDHTSAPYTATRKPHWMGTIVINPFDPDQAMFTTGYGIWSSRDLRAADQGKPTHWEFLNHGLEETVPLALVSPPSGPPLISGLGDIDGFRHDDLERPPIAGTFAGPRFSTTRDIAVAARRPEILARIGNAGPDVFVHVALSTNGALTWSALAGDPPGGADGEGRIALSSDGAVLVWATTQGAVYATADRGRAWTPAEGISAVVSIAADPVDPKRFYAWDAAAGTVHLSSDTARTFVASRTKLPPSPRLRTRGNVLAVTPDRAGEVWVGSSAIGLHRSVDGARTFVPVLGIDGADALGFGRAAPGRDTPALYLRGNVAGVHGFFRSDDAGTTWIRINDDRHQFGSANRPVIIGDPRVYGRAYLTTGGRGILYGEPAGP